jgi:hypothetical protein
VILLDTTVLAYALGSEHPLRDPCRAAVRAIGDGRLQATTTVEVIQEFAHVRARRHGRADAAATAESYATLLAPLVAVDAEDLSRGMTLFREHESLGSFDAVLAAVALRREYVTGLMSADRAFGSIPGLAHIDPSASNLRERLAI